MSGGGELTQVDARGLTDRIKEVLGVAYELIIKAYQGGAWYVLGYDSWDDYCQAEFGAAGMVHLPREQRREIVTAMSDAGMSSREIGSVVSVDQRTVRRDLESSTSTSAANAAEDDQASSTTEYAEEAIVVDAEVVAPEETAPPSGLQQFSAQVEEHAARLVAVDRHYARDLARAINNQLWRTRHEDEEAH